MKRRFLTPTFLLALAAAAPAPAADPVKAAPPRIRGFSIQLNDANATAKYLAAVDELAAMGCTSVNFVIHARQEDIHAQVIAIDFRHVPSKPDLVKIIKRAKERQLTVMVMPVVLLNQTRIKEWRGTIAPPSWDAWFEQYTNFITDMAKIAQRGEADIFSVGSELLSTEDKKDRWTKVITAVKKDFKGRLTYSANWDHFDPDTTGGPSFWDQLDYLSMNCYHELAKRPGLPVARLVKAWDPIKKDILAFVQKQKKPFYFSEVGWHNLQNTIAEPWNYVAEAPLDPQEQERAFDSFVQAWKDVPADQCLGAFIWEWRPGAKATDAGSYSLQDSPALETLKKWMKDPKRTP